MGSLLYPRWLGQIAVAATIVSQAHGASAPSGCEEVLSGFKNRLVDAKCTKSTDLTTANPATTPANNSIAGLPSFAFTPQADRDTIAPDEPHRTPIAGPVPGLQIEARIADDPQGQARVLIRLPDNWNGGLVVAGAPGTRSEFSSDFAWSDYVVQKGYAYVSQNKGSLILEPQTRTTPLRAGPLRHSFRLFTSMMMMRVCPLRAGPSSWQRQPSSGATPSRYIMVG